MAAYKKAPASGLRNDQLAGATLDAKLAETLHLKTTVYYHHNKGAGQIAGMHVEVMADIVAAETILNRWQATASATHRDATVTALNTLNASLTPHLDLEEQQVLPLAGKYLNAAEWGGAPRPRAANVHRRQTVADPGPDPGADARLGD